MKDSLNLLFVHAPRFSSHYRPYGPYMTINLLPMGTFALADLAARNGYTTEILHMGLEWIKTGRFSPADHLKNKKVQVAALPLHWHQQSYDVLETARVIKQEQPDVLLVLGGATASFFHHEIMASYPQVDAIIRGDAEKPLLALMRSEVRQGRRIGVARQVVQDRERRRSRRDLGIDRHPESPGHRHGLDHLGDRLLNGVLRLVRRRAGKVDPRGHAPDRSDELVDLIPHQKAAVAGLRGLGDIHAERGFP